MVALEAIIRGMPHGAEMTPTQIDDNFMLSPGPRRVAIRWGLHLRLLSKRETDHSLYRELYTVAKGDVIRVLRARGGEFKSYPELRVFLEGLNTGLKLNNGGDEK